MVTVAPAVRVELEGARARLTMTRPEAGNSLTLESAAALLDGVRQAQAAGSRVVVLAAEGRAFCVGGDIGAFDGADDRGRYIDDLAEALHRLISELTRMDAIVIAAVQGAAAGAGMPLAAAADLIVAADTARFTLGYTRIGLTPDGGSTLLTSSFGMHRTLAQALLNPVLSAAEAQTAGLVTTVCPAAELGATVDGLAAQLLAGSWPAQVAAKHLIRGRALADAETAMRRESLAVRAAAGTPDATEGLAAFLGKRAPRFPSAG